MHPDAITDCERNAYVDGEIDLARRFAVEDHCARTPEAAASLFADLRSRTALKLAQPRVEAVPDALIAAVRGLEHKFNRKAPPTLAWWSRATGALAAVMVLALTGSLLLSRSGPTQPAYIADAMESHQTSLLRLDMPSQIESPAFDPADIAQNVNIRVPVLPAGWQISDVQVFPSEQGPALQLLVRTSENQTVSIFAVRTNEHAPAQPDTFRQGNMSVAYWRQGAIAYAVIGAEAPDKLDSAAEDLADNNLA